MYTPSLRDTGSYSTARDCHCSCEAVRDVQEDRKYDVAVSAQTIFTKVQQRFIEDDAQEPWICQVPVSTQNLLNAQNILGAL